MRISDLAYFAGFFDGEGCVHLVNRKPMKRVKKRSKKTVIYQPPPRVIVSVGQKEPSVLIELQKSFGGRIQFRKNGHYLWRCDGKSTKKFLESVLPFLRIKKPYAELAIMMLRTNKTRIESFKGLSKEEWEERLKYESLIQGLRNKEKENLEKEVN